jgi:hypothetical protein
MKSPTTRKVADVLHRIGWSAPNDAQLARLDEVIGNGELLAALFHGEKMVRDSMTAQKESP